MKRHDASVPEDGMTAGSQGWVPDKNMTQDVCYTNDPDEYCKGLATVSNVAQSLTVVGRSPKP